MPKQKKLPGTQKENSAENKPSFFITDFDLYLFSHGTHYEVFKKLGAHIIEEDGHKGVHFAVWAPNAMEVSVVGDFNSWQAGKNKMSKLNEGGVWSLFIPGLGDGTLYKYAI